MNAAAKESLGSGLVSRIHPESAMCAILYPPNWQTNQLHNVAIIAGITNRPVLLNELFATLDRAASAFPARESFIGFNELT